MNKWIPDSLRAYAALLPAMIFFALSFVWFKIANVHYGPLTIIFFRLVVSSSLLLAFNCITRQLILPQRADVALICLLGCFEPFLYFVFEGYGLQLLSATVASVIIAMIPLVSPIAAYLFLHERIDWRHIICVLLSMVGVALVVVQRGDNLTGSLPGIILMFGAVCAGVAYTVVLHKAPRRMNILSLILYQNLVGAVLFAPLWYGFEYDRFMASPMEVDGIIAMLQLSIIVSTLAYILFGYGVRNLGINRANLFINIIPALTALFAWLLLGERLTCQKGIGIGIVVSSLYLAARLRVRERAAVVPGA